MDASIWANRSFESLLLLSHFYLLILFQLSVYTVATSCGFIIELETHCKQYPVSKVKWSTLQTCLRGGAYWHDQNTSKNKKIVLSVHSNRVWRVCEGLPWIPEDNFKGFLQKLVHRTASSRYRELSVRSWWWNIDTGKLSRCETFVPQIIWMNSIRNVEYLVEATIIKARSLNDAAVTTEVKSSWGRTKSVTFHKDPYQEVSESLTVEVKWSVFLFLALPRRRMETKLSYLSGRRFVTKWMHLLFVSASILQMAISRFSSSPPITYIDEKNSAEITIGREEKLNFVPSSGSSPNRQPNGIESAADLCSLSRLR